MAAIQQQGNNLQPLVGVPVISLPPNNVENGIAIPNSLWTAGCCVRPNGQNTESFAVIGNNVENSLTQQVTVHWLQTFLAADVTNDRVGGDNVVLFPGQNAGNEACWNENNDVNLPLAQQGR